MRMFPKIFKKRGVALAVTKKPEAPEAKKFTHAMLDLETLGNRSRAPLIQLAAVLFDPLTGEIGPYFNEKIDMEDAVKHGECDGSTIQWWMQQSSAALAAVLPAKGPDGKTLEANKLMGVLGNFSEWLNLHSPDFRARTIWGNGSTFDNVILSNAYSAVGLDKPWSYSGDADVRTVVALGRMLGLRDYKKHTVFVGTPHNALDDCTHQIKYVCAILKELQIKGANHGHLRSTK